MTLAHSARVQELRAPARYDALGYRAATTFREAGVYAGSGSGDYHMRYDRQSLINVSRAMDRDNWLYEAALNRAIDYIVGPMGFTLQAKTGVDGVNRRIEEDLWPAATEYPELRRLFDWPTVQEFTLRELLVAGDTLFLKLGEVMGEDAGRLQHVESERIASTAVTEQDGNTVDQGIVQNKRGQIVGFKVAGSDNNGWIRSSDAQTVAADQCIYVPSRVKRSSASRGMPCFVSSMPIGQRLDDILTSEAIAWQVMSRLAFSITRDEAKTRPPIRPGVNAEERTDPQDQDLDQKVTEVGYAIAVQGRPGDNIQGISQNRPAVNFEQSVKLFIRMFGVPLGIPLELILLDWGKLNYSSARAVLLQAFLNFRRWQQLLVRRFYTPYYHWQIGRAIARGDLAWRPGIFAHTWDVPGWPWIDEDKEVSAWGKKIDRAIATQTEALASLGKDRREHLGDRKREIVEAWQTAHEIEAETAGEVTAKEIWPHLAGLDEGQTAKANRVGAPLAAPPADDENPSDQEQKE